jgi:hypothetical protein
MLTVGDPSGPESGVEISRLNDRTEYIQAVGILAEGLLMVWLLVKGVNVEWQEQARSSIL